MEHDLPSRLFQCLPLCLTTRATVVSVSAESGAGVRTATPGKSKRAGATFKALDLLNLTDLNGTSSDLNLVCRIADKTFQSRNFRVLPAPKRNSRTSLSSFSQSTLQQR
jgi:hypothetical protein